MRRHKMPLRAVAVSPDLDEGAGSGGGGTDAPLVAAPLGVRPVLRAVPEPDDVSSDGTVFGSPPLPEPVLPPRRTIPAQPVDVPETTDTTGRQPTNPNMPARPGTVPADDVPPVIGQEPFALTPQMRRALLVGAGVLALVLVVVVLLKRRRKD